MNMEYQKIVQKRLLTHSTVILANSASVDSFCKLALTLLNESEEGSLAAHRNLIRSLELIEHDHQIAKRAKTISEEEKEEYKQLDVQIKTQIEEAKTDIERLRKELKKERLARQRKEECESLAKLVNEVEDRETSISEIQEVEKVLEEKRNIQNMLDKQYELRKKQFALLMQSLQTLKTELQE